VPKSRRRSIHMIAPRVAVSTGAAAAVADRLRSLPASAGPDAVRDAVGGDVVVVATAADELGRLGDDASIAALEALLTVPAFVIPAIEALGHVRDEAASRLLQRLAAAPPTPQAGKAARRALHTLASAGVALDTPLRSPGAAVFRPLPPDGVAWSGALASPIDALGNRSILLGQKRLPTGAATAIGALSERDGLLYFEAAQLTHRQLDKEWQEFSEQRPETLAQDIPFPYGQWLLAEAAAEMTAAGLDVPEEYTAWLEFTGGRPDAVTPAIIYEAVGVDRAAPPELTPSRSIALLSEPEIEPWMLSLPEDSQLAAELLHIRTSPIVLSEGAQADRERQLVRRSTDELFTSDVRTQYRRRLEETALLFQRSDRSAQATAALATALALGDVAVAPSDIPFAQALTLRALEASAVATTGVADD
jgi:hypothetical protein